MVNKKLKLVKANDIILKKWIKLCKKLIDLYDNII